MVVVAGFQGQSPQGDYATLGRGGSDTSAVALGAALRAKQVEIYTDVQGIYTTDPRIEPKARCLKDIASEEMLEAAQQGAGVMHPRAVELGFAVRDSDFGGVVAGRVRLGWWHADTREGRHGARESSSNDRAGPRRGVGHAAPHPRPAGHRVAAVRSAGRRRHLGRHHCPERVGVATDRSDVHGHQRRLGADAGDQQAARRRVGGQPMCCSITTWSRCR